MNNEAKKFDAGKPRMELLPPKALEEISKVLSFGAEKYGDYNWVNGFDHSRLIGACLRHLTAYMGGEDADKESAVSHLAHSACCLMFLLEFRSRNIGRDDRGYASTSVKDAAKEVMEEHKEVLGKLTDDDDFTISEGKQYVRRDGRTTGVIEKLLIYPEYDMDRPFFDRRHRKAYPLSGEYSPGNEDPNDLMRELS